MKNRALILAQASWKVKGFSQADIDAMSKDFLKSAAANPQLKLKNRLEAIIDGSYSAIRWPWLITSKDAPCLLPGSVTVFAGSPGASKSFAMIQCISHWVKNLVQCSIMCLEGDEPDHMMRMIAQMEENCNITDLDWIRANPIDTMKIYENHYKRIHELGQGIYTATNDDMNYFDVLEWIQDRGHAGDRIVVVDPITAADPGQKSWEGDRQVVIGAHKLAKKYKMSVIFVSHPVKGHLGPSLDSLAGGTAFQRHVDAVLWLEALESRTETIAGACGRSQTEINRVMHLLKVKNGPGQGKKIGFRFEVQSLSLAEQGLILKGE